MKHVKIDDKETPRDSRSSRRPATAVSSSSTYARDSMGRYIGEAPLTIHEQATPSGFDYRPKTSLTTRKPPEYSITGKPYPTKLRQGPSPGDHEITGDLCWDEDKTFYMPPKRKTWPYAPKEDAHLTCSAGAGHYKVVYRDVGSATKHSASSRHKDGINIGPPNHCIQPVDTFGVETPGPDYTPNSPYWDRGPKHHFGVRLRQKSAETPGPGPSAYALQGDLESVQAPFIGERLYVDNDPRYPAPNAYCIPETVGTGLKKSFGIKQTYDAASKNRNPPPNNYIIREPKANGSSMTYRAFHWPLESTPGPSDHDPSVSYTRPHTAEYSCRTKCRPLFPDILNYPAEYGPVEQPAPGHYGYDREFHENSNPAHSIGALLPVKPNNNPAPNRYNIKHSNRSDIASVPSYSMGQVLPKAKSKEETPASCDYQADIGPIKRSAPSYSMPPRRKYSDNTVGPAPNEFNISRGQNHKGMSTGASYSLSSRHSPYRYSGFPSAALAKL